MSPFYADLAERAVRTFVQAALGVIAADLTGITSLDTAKGLVIAAVAAGISAVMSLVARGIGPVDSASVVVPAEVPVQETVVVDDIDPDQDALF
jgi:hypothetical protein